MTMLQIDGLSAGLKYQASRTDTSVVYDSSKGFSPFDLKLDLRDKAEGRISLVDEGVKDAILNLQRRNTAGVAMLKLETRRFPPGEPGSRHRVRVELDARILGSAHTVLVAIKGDGSGPGEHIAEWRERLESETWKSIDAYFDYATTRTSYVRLLDRSVAKAPSSLQIRNLVVTQKD
jgi:hypothetical protein